MGNRSDDFSSKTKKILGRRCGYLCSNPTCDLFTVGAHSDPNKYCMIGEACHIEAASIGGPRYNPNMTHEERRSIKNAIWLCSNCSKKIDSDVNVYPVELLKDWKQLAEKRIHLGNSTLENIANNRIKIIAIANMAGGVAKSFSSAALAYSLYKITNQKVLCISVAQIDHAPMALGIEYEAIESIENENKGKCSEFLDILNSPAGVDTICSYSIENNRRWQENNYGSANFCRILDYIIEKNSYQYIICDCGRGDTLSGRDILLNSTDVVIPIGENYNSYKGIAFIGYMLKKNTSKKNIWILYTMGVLANRHHLLYEEFLKIKEIIARINGIKIRDCRTVIPFNTKVDSMLIKGGNLFENKQIKDVTEAYIQVAQELIKAFK